jgi:hypothetical protein
MSACLQRFQWRSQRAKLPTLHEPGRPDRKGMGRAGRHCRPPGQRRQARRAAGPGKTARRRGSSWPPGWTPGLLGRLPGIHVKVTVASPHVFTGTGPTMPPTSAACWNTGLLSPARQVYDAGRIGEGWEHGGTIPGRSFLRWSPLPVLAEEGQLGSSLPATGDQSPHFPCRFLGFLRGGCTCRQVQIFELVAATPETFQVPMVSMAGAAMRDACVLSRTASMLMPGATSLSTSP